MPLTFIIHRIGHIPPYTATLGHIARFIRVTGLAVDVYKRQVILCEKEVTEWACLPEGNIRV